MMYDLRLYFHDLSDTNLICIDNIGLRFTDNRDIRSVDVQ